MSKEQLNVDKFLQGQIDCQKGKAPASENKDYLRGYATQYQHEQNMDALTDGNK